MTTKAFIQVGQRFFSIQHITAICFDATLGVNEHPAVALYLTGDDEPWKFEHGSPEAEALMTYAHSNTEVLAPPDYEIK
ncbi:hypothetical protein KSF_096180 [Reticulibacter mediterranei]|uniref:Uncharacterized protein n=1 Tax=Reticulibacter mediterranei TaxID=2778369 RepID=A0A8J3IZD1_9CHLR|nr:hypothetical protein [Reticulibacter mediterranei]GHO99570.1 hypothetical protein KSF_096180 [Reticulibacter mediterranei]